MKHKYYVADADGKKVFVTFYQPPSAKYDEHWALHVGYYEGEVTIIEFIGKKRSMAEGRPESSKNFVYILFVVYVNNEKAERLEDAVTMADVEESAEWASQDFVSSVLASMDDKYYFLNQED
jgi:hypothetical protein